MEYSKIIDFLFQVLCLPQLESVLNFAWGTHDLAWIAGLKRTFILLPVLSILVGYWATIAGALTVVVRADRQGYLRTMMLNWWDMGRAIFSFWGGTIKFAFTFIVTLYGVIQILFSGVWALFQTFFFMPFRVAGNMGKNIASPGVPWIAVGLTLFWCLLEATIFTYVCSPLVIDTLSNITGGHLSEATVKAPLYLFLLFLILGSYAVLATWSESLNTKNVATIIKIGMIETVAMFVEVVFLYREFVDALVPWFAQYAAKGFELGAMGTLGIAGITWFGVRGMSWFLFARSGTPTIMDIIQRNGLQNSPASQTPAIKDSFALIKELVEEIKSELDWMSDKGEDLLAAFILPPLQVFAASINFCTLVATRDLPFTLPFESLEDLNLSHWNRHESREDVVVKFKGNRKVV